MRDAGVARLMREGGDLYERIGAFLADQGLSPEPAHYSFAYGVLTDPQGDLAGAVARLTEGGVRLSRHDIEALGGTVALRTGAGAASPVTIAPGPVTVAPGRAAAPGPEQRAQELVAETQAQVDDFATMMRAMQDETRGFGRDLAESAAAIHHVTPATALDGIARVTGGMMVRIRDAEIRLAQATEETDALRAKLAEARDTARRDPLTGLPNRRAFDEAYAARDAAAGPWCLAVCDIDRFKRVNDEFGHGVGDRVLDAIGRTLAECCAGHLVVRYGGEEFAVLFAGIDLAHAADLLDGARATIAAKRFRDRETGQPLGRITLSAGVTAVRDGESSDAPMERADRLLYTAKTGGRDQVCAA